MTSTEPRRAGEGQDGQRDGQGPGQPPGTPGPDTTRVPEHGGLGHRWMGLDLGSPPLVPPFLPPCPGASIYSVTVFVRGAPVGASRSDMGVQPPLPLPVPPKPAVPPHTRSSLTQWGGRHLDTVGRSGSGSGGCECPLPRGFGVSPPPWGCPPPCPGLALAGRAGSGGGSHWRGCFPLRGHVGTLSPPRSVQLCLHSAVGGPGGLAVPTQGGSRWAACCILHVWGCLGVGLGAGGAAVTIPAPNFGEGDPNLPGTSGGSWEWSKTGGEAQPSFSAEPPTPHVPRAAPRPPTRAWGPAAAVGGSVGTPYSSGRWLHPHRLRFCLGGRDQRPAVWAGRGQVPLAGSRPAPAL